MKIVYSLRSSGCIPNSEIYFSIIKKESEECLRRMNRSLFLVLYDDSYYDALFSSELSYSLMIHSGDEESIGTVSFRVQGSDAYLYTFGLLPHLRGLGLGSLILAHLESYIKSQFGISTLSLHVHSSNERALAFYQRNGFKIRLILPEYYVDVYPTSAYFMVKDVSQYKKRDLSPCNLGNTIHWPK